MAEYIEREAALQHKRKMGRADFGGEFWDEAVLCEDIRKIPAADVVEVRHGEWVDEDFPELLYNGRGTAICSACKNLSHFAEHGYPILSTYCPNCGAKMDGKGKG